MVDCSLLLLVICDFGCFVQIRGSCTCGQPGTGKLSSPIRSTWNPNFQQKPHNEFTKKTEKCLAQPPHGLHSRSCLRWDLPTIKRLVWPYIRVGSLVLDGVCLWGGKGATTVACAIQPLHALQIIQDGVFSIYYPLSIQFSPVMKNDKYISPIPWFIRTRTKPLTLAALSWCFMRSSCSKLPFFLMPLSLCFPGLSAWCQRLLHTSRTWFEPVFFFNSAFFMCCLGCNTIFHSPKTDHLVTLFRSWVLHPNSIRHSALLFLLVGALILSLVSLLRILSLCFLAFFLAGVSLCCLNCGYP